MGLEDVSPSVKASAAATLARFRNPRAVGHLLTLIAGVVDDESQDAQLAVSVLLALGEIGDRRVVPSIMEKAEADNPEIKEAALKALGLLGDPRAESCLIEALTSEDPRIRMQAAESLGKI